MAVRSTHEWPDDDPVETTAVIDLGVTAPTPEEPVRRRRPRWYLGLAGAGLVAIGFVGGLTVQRATTSDPAESPSPVAAPDQVYSVPSPYGCRWYRGDATGAELDSMCSGTVRSVASSGLVLELPDGTPLGMVVDRSTTVVGARGVSSLRPGEYVTVRTTTGSDGRLHAGLIMLI